VESGLRNLDGGDADSVGFFQMRLSVWNQGEYAGYGDHPERQLDWFLDHAEAMKNQRIERGLSVTDSKQYGEWIADVERPAAQYRGRYQGQLDEARGLLASADGSHRVGNALADVAADVGGATAGPGALAALAAARNELGVPYLWGGSSPKTGFDCSGLVQWAYAKAGIQLPRIAADQFEAPSGTAVSRRDLLPGDLVFFKDSIGYVHHVGMYVGNDRFLAAPHTGDVVKISSLKEPYYAQEFAGGRRFARPGAAALEDAAARPEAVSRQAAAEAEAVRLAQAALERDAAEVNRFNSALFLALARQEQGKGAPGA
jgi:cell wall-associated NlpC family hydrolase